MRADRAVPIKDGGPSLQTGQRPEVAQDGLSETEYNRAHGRSGPVTGGPRKTTKSKPVSYLERK